MRFASIIIALTYLLLGSSQIYGKNPTNPPSKGIAPLKILTFNLQCFSQDWKLRLEKLSTYIIENDFTVIALQEVCSDIEKDQGEGKDDALDFIVQTLSKAGKPPHYAKKVITHRAWDKYDESLAIISLIPVTQEQSAQLPPSRFQRYYMGVKIDSLWIVNTHLEYGDDQLQERTEQIKTLIKTFDQKSVVVTGDFNSEPQDQEQSHFLNAQFRSSFAGPSYPSHQPRVAIDGFWCSHKIQSTWSVTENKIHFSEPFLKDLYLSDHLGVSLEISRN